ncbi:uncharacterized protein LOC111105264 [Crassostrea virginica]
MLPCALITLSVWSVLELTTFIEASTPFDALNIHRPHVDIIAEQNGNLTLLSGVNGNIRILPGANETGSVYFDGEDLLYLIQLTVSLPPVWEDHSPFGYVGEFHSGDRVSIQLRALDPEGTKVTYQLIGGELPPGVKLDSDTGILKGLAPNTEDLFTFTIRALDSHVKYADHVFKMLIRGANKCDSNPCTHEGQCHEENGSYSCRCAHPYGGKTCDLDCRSNSLGVRIDRRWIPDAQMTAYKSNGNSFASAGRLSSSAWRGVDASSWLQVDLGNITRVYGTVMQYAGSRQYTSSYFLQYSTDGDNFHNYTVGGQLTKFSAGASTYTRPLPEPMDARFVRFIPLGWYSSSYGPYMRVDILGCHYYTL